MAESTGQAAGSRGQNTMKHSQVSQKTWCHVPEAQCPLCPFPARMVPHLHHILVSCGPARLWWNWLVCCKPWPSAGKGNGTGESFQASAAPNTRLLHGHTLEIKLSYLSAPKHPSQKERFPFLYELLKIFYIFCDLNFVIRCITELWLVFNNSETAGTLYFS